MAYGKPRKRPSKETIAKWTENSRNQDRSKHPFIARNSILFGEAMAFIDSVEETKSALGEYENFKTVDGDPIWAEKILDR